MAGKVSGLVRFAFSPRASDAGRLYFGNVNAIDAVSTDDAYIQGDIAIISPKVSGYVEKVNVVENQQVHAGDPLVTIESQTPVRD